MTICTVEARTPAGIEYTSASHPPRIVFSCKREYRIVARNTDTKQLVAQTSWHSRLSDAEEDARMRLPLQ